MLPWIRSAALHTTAAVGPSGLDALGWRRLRTSFKSASLEPCHFLALVTKCLCTELVDAATITPLMASHLIALDKNPGVHPIGIGDTARRIIAKAILNITRQDVQEAAGSIQLCAGQISSIEATVHVTMLTSSTAHSLCTVHNWLDSAMLAIYTPIGMCGDSAPFLAVECTKLVQTLIKIWSKEVSNYSLGIYMLRLPPSAQESKLYRSLGLGY